LLHFCPGGIQKELVAWPSPATKVNILKFYTKFI